MSTITGALFQTLFKDSTTSATTFEVLADDAIDKINTYMGDAQIPNLAGTAGTKSLTVESSVKGAITSMTREVYKVYKNPDTSNINAGPLGMTYGNDNQLLSFARQLASQLRKNEIQVLKG